MVAGKLFLIVKILSVKNLEKACGRSSESKEDGTGVEFFLPKMVLKFGTVPYMFCLLESWKTKRLFLHCPLNLRLPV